MNRTPGEVLPPVTYWERRVAALEGGFLALASIVSGYVLPPAAQQDLKRVLQEWGRACDDADAVPSATPPPTPAPTRPPKIL